MSFRSVVFLLLVAFACISLSYSAILCPANELFKVCGTACEHRCNVPPPKQCIAKCVSACQCVDGYLRNSVNRCVLPEDC